MNRCERSSSPFACASPASRITHPTPNCPQNIDRLTHGAHIIDTGDTGSEFWRFRHGLARHTKKTT